MPLWRRPAGFTVVGGTRDADVRHLFTAPPNKGRGRCPGLGEGAVPTRGSFLLIFIGLEFFKIKDSGPRGQRVSTTHVLSPSSPTGSHFWRTLKMGSRECPGLTAHWLQQSLWPGAYDPPMVPCPSQSQHLPSACSAHQRQLTPCAPRWMGSGNRRDTKNQLHSHPTPSSAVSIISLDPGTGKTPGRTVRPAQKTYPGTPEANRKAASAVKIAASPSSTGMGTPAAPTSQMIC